MKYLLVIPDGMADTPQPEISNKTPLQAARKKNMDALAQKGIVGQVHTVPENYPPGSDVAIMSIFGYDPKKYYTGRGPLEAKANDLPVTLADVVFRCNLVASDGAHLVDYSAGHVSNEEAVTLMALVERKLSTQTLTFYPGVQYRHILVWKNSEEPLHAKCYPPHDIMGKTIKEHLPQGGGEKVLQRLVWDSMELLDNHDINKRRRDEGKLPANMLWPWGQGKVPAMTTFYEKYKKSGAVITAVDLVRGLARCAELDVVGVPGATGYYDTNYEGKADYAVNALKDHDFVAVHVEATDEAGHNGDLEKKIWCIEQFDKRLLGNLLSGLEKQKIDFKMLLLPDHPTPVHLRTHTRAPVPFILYDSANPNKGEADAYDEEWGKASKWQVEEGHELLGFLLS